MAYPVSMGGNMKAPQASTVKNNYDYAHDLIRDVQFTLSDFRLKPSSTSASFIYNTGWDLPSTSDVPHDFKPDIFVQRVSDLFLSLFREKIPNFQFSYTNKFGLNSASKICAHFEATKITNTAATAMTTTTATSSISSATATK